ncbi:hypothetical protein CcI49_37085 [Frankia sp. CcI49]|nr:hypothetical protein CcI49_37085 [Frankia sp. CcI49]
MAVTMLVAAMGVTVSVSVAVFVGSMQVARARRVTLPLNAAGRQDVLAPVAGLVTGGGTRRG